MEKDSGSLWNWVWECILKQPIINEKTLNSLLLTIPLPTNNPNLPKFILLAKLKSHNNSFLESHLPLLEQIHEIDTLNGLQPSDAMKRAYCAIAVQLAVKHLTISGEQSEFLFFETVKRVWRNRIGFMKSELGSEGGLGSEQLWDWMEQLEAAVWDNSVLHSVLEKSKGINAVEAVNVYLDEEMEKVGTSFVESLRDRVDGDDSIKEMAGLIDVGVVPVGLDRKKKQLRNRNVGGYKCSRGVKITDSYEEDVAGPSKRTRKLPLSIDANNACEALNTSSKELREVVKDPLPEALRVAEQVRLSSRNGKGVEQDTEVIVLDDDDDVVVQESPRSRVPEKDAKEQSGPGQTSRGGLSNSPSKKINSLSKDEIDNLKTRDRLSKDEIDNLKRRDRKKWTPEEEDTLRAGVKKYGKGNWVLILTVYADVFIGRTYVDLKDKWRNMTRYTRL